MNKMKEQFRSMVENYAQFLIRVNDTLIEKNQKALSPWEMEERYDCYARGVVDGMYIAGKILIDDYTIFYAIKNEIKIEYFKY